MLIGTIVLFVGLLLVLVLIHELGHFIVARWAGCKVEEFGFGFPPRIWGIKRGETLYSINAIPLGGFVKIEGEDMEEATASPRSFAAKSARWRIAILVAGVIMNLLLAVVLLMVQAGIGSPIVVTDENAHRVTDVHTYIQTIAPNSPAAAAGIQELDRIVSLQGVSNPSSDDVQRIIDEQAGQQITLVLNRQGIEHTVTLTPRIDPPPNEGKIGVALLPIGLDKVAWWQAPWEGLKKTVLMTVAIFVQFAAIIGRLVQEGNVADTLTGPIGIAIYTQEAVQMGIGFFLEFAALVSLNLAIINILPFPALDGGRVAFVLLEKITGSRRISLRFEKITHTLGFALLIGLMILITIKDIRNFF